MSLGGAQCAVHHAVAAEGSCERCGRFACARCLEATPCLECQVLVRGDRRPMPPWLPLVLEAFTWAFIATDVLDAVLGGQGKQAENPFDLNPLQFASLMMNTVLFLGAWLGVVGAFVLWFVHVVVWADTHGAPIRRHVVWQVFEWFIPLVNLALPFHRFSRTLRGARVEAPVLAWWLASCAAVGTLGWRLGHSLGGTLGYLEIAFEVASAGLMIAVVRQVSKAIGAREPARLLEARDEGLVRAGAGAETSTISVG
jgi:hypothetical protein